MKDNFTTYPLVSIITVNYNQSSVTLDLLKSLGNITYPNVEVIVVDNASPNDRAEVISESYPNVQLIKSNTNLGFAGGNNLGVRASKGEYLMFINNDTEVPEGFLEPLVELFQKDERIGMVSPKIKFHWNKELIQYAGYTKMNPYTIRNSSIGYHQKDGEKFSRLEETNAAHGAAMMVPRRVIEKVGMMTEIYFLYYEEHDWSEMIKRAGYTIYYQPESFILHKESVSTGKDSPFKTYYLTRNRLVFARRNLNGFTRIISIGFQFFISLPKNTLVFILKGQFAHLKAYWRGVLWNLVNYRSIQNNPKLIAS